MPGIDVHIANKIEILPGNILILPGCEPASALTSVTLERNTTCKCSYIRLDVALQAIPTATIVTIRNMNPKRRFFVLPDGPPPQMGTCCKTYGDWYDVLRDAACGEEPTGPNCEMPVGPCAPSCSGYVGVG